MRSYYAVDGDYHLFATSRKLVERFYEAAPARASLAAGREFRHARAGYPLSRGDSVFLFLSTAFMEHLVSPQYQIEIGRRLAGSVDLEMLQLARLAAKAEGRSEASIDEFVVGGYLPANFGLRCDSSRSVWPDLTAGVPVDSQRGGRSSFKPVSDMPVGMATPREVEDYRALAQYVAARVEYVEPWVAAIKLLAPRRRAGARDGRSAHQPVRRRRLRVPRPLAQGPAADAAADGPRARQRAGRRGPDQRAADVRRPAGL